jgi:hypothetical protein
MSEPDQPKPNPLATRIVLIGLLLAALVVGIGWFHKPPLPAKVNATSAP